MQPITDPGEGPRRKRRSWQPAPSRLAAVAAVALASVMTLAAAVQPRSAAAQPAAAQPTPPQQNAALSVAGYRAALETILGDLRQGEDAAAAAAARRLSLRRVTVGQGRTESVATDRHLLAEVAAGSSATGLSRVDRRRLQARLELLIAELGRRPLNATPDGEGAAPSADQAMLETVRAAQRRSGPEAGGGLPGIDLGALDLESPWFSRLRQFRDWLGERLTTFGRWLRDLFGSAESGTALDARQVALLVGLAAVAVLAATWWSRRRSRAVIPGGSSPPSPPAAGADADPRSREVDEWRRYAAELAASGRHREAIRAWYHAVLVALYARGLLAYRRDRTNWEYVAALAHNLPWRSRFVELTRRFESAWYGHHGANLVTLGGALEDSRMAAEEVLAALAGGAPR